MAQSPSDPSTWILMQQPTFGGSYFSRLQVHSDDDGNGGPVTNVTQLTPQINRASFVGFDAVTKHPFIAISETESVSLYKLDLNVTNWPPAGGAVLNISFGMMFLMESILVYGEHAFVIASPTVTSAQVFRFNISSGTNISILLPEIRSGFFSDLKYYPESDELLFAFAASGVLRVAGATGSGPLSATPIRGSCLQVSSVGRLADLPDALLVACSSSVVLLNLTTGLNTTLLDTDEQFARLLPLQPTLDSRMLITGSNAWIRGIQLDAKGNPQVIDLATTSACGIQGVLRIAVDAITGEPWLGCYSNIYRARSFSLSTLTSPSECLQGIQSLVEVTPESGEIAFTCQGYAKPNAVRFASGAVVLAVTNPNINYVGQLAAGLDGTMYAVSVVTTEEVADVAGVISIASNGTVSVVGAVPQIPEFPVALNGIMTDQNGTIFSEFQIDGTGQSGIMQLKKGQFDTILFWNDLPNGCYGAMSTSHGPYFSCNAMLVFHNNSLFDGTVENIYQCSFLTSSSGIIGGRFDYDDGRSVLWLVCDLAFLELIWDPRTKQTPVVQSTPLPPSSVCARDVARVQSVAMDPQRQMMYLACSTDTTSTTEGALAMLRWKIGESHMETLIPPSTCSALSLLAVGRLTSTVYLLCDSSSISAWSDGFRCASGFEFSYGFCNSCAASSARPTVTFNQSAVIIPKCHQCTPGSIAPFAGSASCAPCPAGAFQVDLSSSTQFCSPCVPGTFANVSGLTACLSCEAGSFASIIGATSCTACVAGEYATANASTLCLPCERGSASNATGLTNPCLPCPAGSEAPQYRSTSCSPCPLGWNSPSGGVCGVCSPGTYTPSVGAPCISCADQDGLECMNGLAYVQEGYWAYTELDPVTGLTLFRTTACPIGHCPAKALQSSQGQENQGRHDDSLLFCDWPRRNDAENWLCAACVDSYLPWAGQCVPCHGGVNWGLLFLLLFLCLILVIWLLHQVSSASAAGLLTLLLYFAQASALELGPLVEWLAWLQAVNLGSRSSQSDGGGSGAGTTCLAPLTPVQQTILTYLVPAILCGLLALVALVHVSLTVLREQCSMCHWMPLRLVTMRPSKYVGCIVAILLTCYQPISVAVVQSLHCVQVAPGQRLLFDTPSVDCNGSDYKMVLLPITICVGLVFMVGFPIASMLFLRQHKAWLETESQSTEVRATTPAMMHAAAMTDNSSSRIMSMFLSRPLRGSSSTSEDASQAATSAETVVDSAPSASYHSVVDASASGSSSESSSHSSFRLRYGILYLSFRPGAWHWQGWVVFRRAALALVSVLLLPTSTTRYILFAAIHVLSAILHALVFPFASSALNWSELVSHVCLIALSLLLASVKTPLNAATQAFLCILTVPWAAALLVAIAFQQYKRLKGAFKQVRQSHSVRPESAFGLEDVHLDARLPKVSPSRRPSSSSSSSLLVSSSPISKLRSLSYRSMADANEARASFQQI